MIRILKKLLLIIVFLSHSSSYAQAEFYTIQTGTYAQSALKYAEKHFHSLTRSLDEGGRDFLRIEKGEKYYIVRLGKFKDRASARQLLKKVKKIVLDAFLLKIENFDVSRIVNLYQKPALVLTEYYTLQIGNFLRPDQAREEFNALTRILEEEDRHNLRIERIGRYFSVRVGKFHDYASAREFLQRIDNQISGGTILKAFLKDEQVLIVYGDHGTDESPVSEKQPISTGDLSFNDVLDETEITENQESIDNLFNDIADKYYNQQYGKAAELIKEGITKWPGNSDLYAWYGATLLSMEFPDKALEQYQKAVELSPEVSEYHAGLGHSLLNIYMDRAKDSIEAFKKALEIDPENISALEGLGLVYATIDKKDLATQIYYQLQDLDREAASRLHEIITWGLDWEE